MNFLFFFILFTIFLSLQHYQEISVWEKRKEKGEIYCRWTLPFIVIYYLLLIATITLEIWLVKRNPNLFITGIGIFLFMVRFVIKKQAMKMLGCYWSAHVEIQDRQKLITTGVYKLVRHPAYLANILEVCALPLIANAYYTLFFVFPIYLLFILWKIGLEEKILAEKFGNEYKIYKKTTPMLLPVPWVKKEKRNESIVGSTTT